MSVGAQRGRTGVLDDYFSADLMMALCHPLDLLHRFPRRIELPIFGLGTFATISLGALLARYRSLLYAIAALCAGRGRLQQDRNIEITFNLEVGGHS